MKSFAPVAMFVYNRLTNTRESLSALQKNTLAPETDLYIYSDAPKNEKNVKKVADVRQYIKSLTGFKTITIIERKENFYIEKNIIEGVTEIINQHGRVIVLEDDGVTSQDFLTFMNKSLDLYETYKQVMHIATFTFIKPHNKTSTFFLRYSENSGGGWATWKDRWSKFSWFHTEKEGLEKLTDEKRKIIELDGSFKCLNALKLKPIPWDICWLIAIISNDGLSVNSPFPLIRNNGLYNGTHFNFISKLLGKSPFEINIDGQREENIEYRLDIGVDPENESMLKSFYSNLEKQSSSVRSKIIGLIFRTLVKLKITKFIKYIYNK